MNNYRYEMLKYELLNSLLGFLLLSLHPFYPDDKKNYVVYIYIYFLLSFPLPFQSPDFSFVSIKLSFFNFQRIQ